MTLKNVVLPAPFGPMRLTIEPSGMTKSTFETATSPPNCFVTARASRTLLIARRPRSGRAPARPRPRSSSAACSSAFTRALGKRPSGRTSIITTSAIPKMSWRDRLTSMNWRSWLLIACADAVDEPRDPVEEHAVDEAEQETTGDDPADVAEAAEDDHAEDEDRDREVELLRRDDLQVAGPDRPGEAGEARAEREGEQLRRHQVHAHRRRGDLILAHRGPRPADARCAQSRGDQHR